MLTICLIAALVISAVVVVCTVGATVASILLVLFGDLLVATLIIVGIVKLHKFFKNRKKK